MRPSRRGLDYQYQRLAFIAGRASGLGGRARLEWGISDVHYTIRDQFNNRFPGWSVRAGFPTIVGEGKPFCAGGSYDNDETDPYVQPIIAHLTIYIVRTINRLYFADYLSDAEIPKAWPLGFGLEKLLKASENEKAAGIIKPRGLIEFVNRRESVSAK